MSRHNDEVEIIARGVCVKAGRLLLCHSMGSDVTYLPGGHVDFGESAKVALAREIGEEMGVRASVGEFLGAIEHRFRQKGRWHSEVNLIFHMNIPGMRGAGNIKACEDWIEFLWLDLSRLRRSNLEPAPLRKCIPAWLHAGRPVRWASTY
jgi:8-oxo-dGTP diphosphatase